jgi:peroxiredoxin
VPQWHRGDLRVGDTAPDAKLVALDGSTFHLRDRIGRRPLVLVFGSYT